jgi:hypothetical protein
VQTSGAGTPLPPAPEPASETWSPVGTTQPDPASFVTKRQIVTGLTGIGIGYDAVNGVYDAGTPPPTPTRCGCGGCLRGEALRYLIPAVPEPRALPEPVISEPQVVEAQV